MSKLGAELDRVQLPGGWSGLVFIGPRFPAAGSEAVGALDAAQWKPALAQLVLDREALPGYARLKCSEGVEVFRATVEAGTQCVEIVGKHSRARGLSRRLAQALGRGRQRRNFHRALMLSEAGIRTPRPVALVERRWPSREAWLITEFVPDVADLDHVALQLASRLSGPHARQVKNGLLEVVVALFVDLQRRGFRHRDLKASNILLTEWDSGENPIRVWLADLDGLSRARVPTGGGRWQALVRLSASLMDRPAVTRGDHVRFLRRYLTLSASDTAAWKPLFRRLARQSRAYVKRSYGRKSHKLDGYTGA